MGEFRKVKSFSHGRTTRTSQGWALNHDGPSTGSNPCYYLLFPAHRNGTRPQSSGTNAGYKHFSRCLKCR